MAIKCIQKSSLSKTATENLLTEIELLKKLDHEHIVKLKDFEVSVIRLSFIILIPWFGLATAFILIRVEKPQQFYTCFLLSGMMNIFS